MKVFFGIAIDDMMTELRSQAARTVRLHVLPTIEGQNLIMQVHLTSLCNNQVYESVLESRASLDDVPKDQMDEFVREQCEQVRAKAAERLEGLEVRRGILQE